LNRRSELKKSRVYDASAQTLFGAATRANEFHRYNGLFPSKFGRTNAGGASPLEITGEKPLDRANLAKI
jgi:hypothetical protein